MHSAWLRNNLLRFLKFVQIKEGDLISWGEGTNSAEQLNYLLPLLYLNFESFKDPNSFLFLRFQCTLHGYGVLSKTFHISTNYTEGTRFLGRTNSAAVWIIWSFCLSCWKFSRTQILRRLLDLNAFCIIQEK